jgi:hypothetical protein
MKLSQSLCLRRANVAVSRFSASTIITRSFVRSVARQNETSSLPHVAELRAVASEEIQDVTEMDRLLKVVGQ